jgi:4-hydroxybenzoate polyprenyltransferase/phosphoserine phosphatase
VSVLIVDLDGTLLRSDMLFETFWSSIGRNWRSTFRALVSLRKGKAALKHDLAETAEIDVATLPYDAEVVAYVAKFRAEGGRTALVTASSEILANRIAEHLKIFDEVHGSTPDVNIKGERKAAFLVERFGTGGFSYMGDAEADLPVWTKASSTITVNASPSLRSKADKLGKPAEHLVTVTPSVKPYLKALRPHQWLKNVLVFLPMLTAHQINATTFGQSLLAFVAFSFVASSVYVLNDLLDLGADRAHPRKRLRPFAAGTIPISQGTTLAAGMLLLGIVFSAFLGWVLLLVMLVYYVLTTAYSLNIKRRVVVDICLLAGLYTMRIIAGGAATSIPLSVWLLAFSIFFFFSLAAVKRQAELVDAAERGELSASGRGYRVEDLPIISMIALAAGYVSVLVMALYVNSPQVLELYAQPAALWGVSCILLYWITRMVLVTHRGDMDDDPIIFAVKDWNSQVCLVVILMFGIGGAFL